MDRKDQRSELLTAAIDCLSKLSLKIPELVYSDKNLTLFLAMTSFRIRELASSTNVLLNLDRCRDASILFLSAYELMLDVRYVLIDKSRADAWLNHSRLNKKPWTVRNQQAIVFDNEEERQKEEEVFEYLSMIKHCNPKAGTNGFPVALSHGKITLSDSSQEKRRDFLAYAFLYTLNNTLNSTLKVLRDAEIDIEDILIAAKFNQHLLEAFDSELSK